jgi:hypothetical protein
MDVPAQIMNGRVMLPIRAISESIGADISWDNETRTVTVSKGDRPADAGGLANYLRNFPEVPDLINAIDVDLENVTIIVNRSDLLVLFMDLKGVKTEEVDYEQMAIVQELVIEAGFKRFVYEMKSNDEIEKYTKPVDHTYATYRTEHTNGDVMVMYVINGGGAEMIDSIIITRIQ